MMSSKSMSRSVIGNCSDAGPVDAIYGRSCDANMIGIVDVHSERSMPICMHGGIRAAPCAAQKKRKPINTRLDFHGSSAAGAAPERRETHMVNVIARVVYRRYTDTQMLDTAIILSRIYEDLIWQAGEPKCLDLVRNLMKLVAVECVRRGIRLAGIAGY